MKRKKSYNINSVFNTSPRYKNRARPVTAPAARGFDNSGLCIYMHIPTDRQMDGHTHTRAHTHIHTQLKLK